MSEYIEGSGGHYTQKTFEFILEQLRRNPLVPGQQIILYGHSGGGAIAANLSSMLERQLHNERLVAGVITAGSPLANLDRALGVADNVVDIAHRSDALGAIDLPPITINFPDWVPGLPEKVVIDPPAMRIRSSEGRKALAQVRAAIADLVTGRPLERMRDLDNLRGALARLARAAEQVNPGASAHWFGTTGQNPTTAHSAYHTSSEVRGIIARRFPAVLNALDG